MAASGAYPVGRNAMCAGAGRCTSRPIANTRLVVSWSDELHAHLT